MTGDCGGVSKHPQALHLAVADQCRPQYYKRESVSKVLQESDCLLLCPCLTEGIDQHIFVTRLVWIHFLVRIMVAIACIRALYHKKYHKK